MYVIICKNNMLVDNNVVYKLHKISFTFPLVCINFVYTSETDDSIRSTICSLKYSACLRTTYSTMHWQFAFDTLMINVFIQYNNSPIPHKSFAQQNTPCVLLSLLSSWKQSVFPVIALSAMGTTIAFSSN